MAFSIGKSISQRFIFGLAIVIISTLVVFFIAFISYNARSAEKELNKQADHILSFSKKSLASAMWQYNQEYVKDYIDSLFLYDDIVFAESTIESQVIKTKTRTGYQQPELKQNFNSDDFIIRKSRVEYNQDEVGSIIFVMSKDSIAKEVLRNSLAVVLLLLFLSVIISVTMIVLFRKHVMVPLVNLDNSAKKIADGALDTFIDTSSLDELGQLAKTFSQMMQNIRTITASRDELNSEITERKRAEKIIKENLKEKEVLLKEVHHRVKNNLQLIQSLLRLQINTVNSDALKKPLVESTNRIKAMSLIHETLYRSDNMGNLDADDYFKSIIRHLLKIYQRNDFDVEIDIEVHPIDLEMDSCVSCGLILNELVSNALKHAFNQSTGGKLSIRFTEKTPNQAVLTIMDDGCGLPPELIIEESDSLGLKIVNLIVIGQLEGTLTVNQNQGTRIDIHFPLHNNT